MVTVTRRFGFFLAHTRTVTWCSRTFLGFGVSSGLPSGGSRVIGGLLERQGFVALSQDRLCAAPQAFDLDLRPQVVAREHTLHGGADPAAVPGSDLDLRRELEGV